MSVNIVASFVVRILSLLLLFLVVVVVVVVVVIVVVVVVVVVVAVVVVVFDCLPYSLLIAKLDAYGFDKTSTEYLKDY